MPTFPVPGDELGGYRIEEMIGRGGMSVVYLAEQLALGRKVALKLLSPELSEDEEFRQRFIRESRLAGGLEHPNIIPVHEAGDVEGLLFIAMRYVKGSDLKALLQREGQLSLDHTIKLISQAAGALDAAHSRGLVHRDVKPGNLLVASGEGPEASEHIYLSDFGLTKKTDSKSQMTSTGSFVGTLDYVAPEQIQGKDVTGRADLYSLACVTFECLTRSRPFERDSEVAVMYAHLQDPPPKLSDSRPDLPSQVEGVIARAMAKDPNDRFETSRDFVRALDAVTDIPPMDPPSAQRSRRSRSKKGPAATPPPTAQGGSTPAKPVRDSQEITQPRTPRAMTEETARPDRGSNSRLLLLLALPVIAGGAFFLTRQDDSPQEGGKTDRTTEVATSPGGETPTAGDQKNSQTGPPGQIAFLEETASGSERFFVSLLANPPDARRQKIPDTTGFDWRNRRPDWAPSGDFFAFAQTTSEGDLDLVAIDPRSPGVRLEELQIEGSQGSVSVSPDGRTLAFSQTVDSNQDIYLWTRSRGTPKRLTTSPGIDDSPEWSQDGERIVFEGEGVGGNDIFIVDADGEDLRRVTKTPNINEKLPEFHPTDESLILYHQQEPGGDFGVYIHDTDDPMTEQGTKIIDTPAHEMRPTWSPDGAFIAFDSDTEGNIDIFIIPFPGLAELASPSEAIQVTDGPHDEQSPAWGPRP